MREKGHILQLAPMDHLIRESGANRVSDSAKRELRKIIESFALNLSRKAIKLANHAGRTTVKGEDISLAFNNNKGVL